MNSGNFAPPRCSGRSSGDIVLGEVRLKGFRLTDWFPRAPGVYWSPDAARARESAWARPAHNDTELGLYVDTYAKMGLIETYDKAVFNHYSGDIKSAQIDKIVQKSVVQFGHTNVSNNINVGGSAIINIDSILKGVTQTIGGAAGLDKRQKAELEELVNSLKSDLEAVKASRLPATWRVIANRRYSLV